MPSSHHLLSSCTNASLGLPSLPKSATLTQQPLQVCEWIATHSDTFRSQADKDCKSLAPLYAGQPVAMYDALHNIWVPTIVVHVLPKDSYQAHTSDGTVYHSIRWYLCEYSVKPADSVPDATTTTPQAPARPHISVPQPAPTKPAQPVEPTPVAPATPKPPTTAVSTTPAVPKVTPAPTPVTPSVAPMQPRRSGCAHVAPNCLIQEM